MSIITIKQEPMETEDSASFKKEHDQCSQHNFRGTGCSMLYNTYPCLSQNFAFGSGAFNYSNFVVPLYPPGIFPNLGCFKNAFPKSLFQSNVYAADKYTGENISIFFPTAYFIAPEDSLCLIAEALISVVSTPSLQVFLKLFRVPHSQI